MYWAAQGQGAYVQRGGQDAQRMQCAQVDLGQPGLVVVGSASHLTDETREFVAQLKEPAFKQLGSSLKLLMVGAGRGRPGPGWRRQHMYCEGDHPRCLAEHWHARVSACAHDTCGPLTGRRPTLCSAAARTCPQVAEGVAHIYPRLAPTCEWDTAAAHIIVEEAGGSVLQAGLCDSKGKLLEDWKVGGQGGARGSSCLSCGRCQGRLPVRHSRACCLVAIRC